MPTWKKVIVSGSNISQLNNDSGYLTSATVNHPNGFATASFSGTNLLADSPTGSLNFASSSGQGLTISANAGNDTLTFGLSSIPNSSLQNDSIGGISLGGSFSTLTSGTGLTGGVYDPGSLGLTFAISGASALSTNTVTKWTGTGFANTTITDNGSVITTTTPLNVGGAITASGAISSSAGLLGTTLTATSNVTVGGTLSVTNALTASIISASSGITGSLFGTASWAQSASNAINSQTASFLPVGTYNITSSWAQSASNAINARTASFLPVGTYSITSSWAQSASNAINSQTASFLPVGTYSITSSWATNALTASNITPAITNNTDNRVLTATGGGTINGESNLTFDGTTLTVTGNTVISNNLTVQGTASFQETTNLTVADRFILLASGSGTSPSGDGGIVIQQTGSQGVGEAFGWDATNTSRWGVTSSFSANQAGFTPDAFMAAVVTAAGTTPSPATRYNAVGNIYVSSGDESIWIYS